MKNVYQHLIIFNHKIKLVYQEKIVLFQMEIKIFQR